MRITGILAVAKSFATCVQMGLDEERGKGESEGEMGEGTYKGSPGAAEEDEVDDW